jgi:hypothetical protein
MDPSTVLTNGSNGNGDITNIEANQDGNGSASMSPTNGLQQMDVKSSANLNGNGNGDVNSDTRV